MFWEISGMSALKFIGSAIIALGIPFATALAENCFTQCADVSRKGDAQNCTVFVKNVCAQPLSIIVYCQPGISCSRTGITIQPGASFTASTSPARAGQHKWSFGSRSSGAGYDNAYYKACGSKGLGCTGSNCW